MSTNLTDFFSNLPDSDWLAALDELLPCIHEVDRNAVQIWFRFYPVDLKRYVDESEDRDKAIQGLALQGDFELKDQIDTSHHFLYGHRYWPTIKRKIEKVLSESRPVGTSAGGTKGASKATSGSAKDAADAPANTLADVIKQVGMLAAEKLGVERNLVNAIAAAGLATLQQVGVEAFTAASGEVEKPTGIMAKPPAAIIAERAKDDSQGLLGFLKTINKKFSIRYDNGRLNGKFAVMNDQEIAGASGADRSRDWKQEDERCWEGVVPVECLSASCGTCWIGVLGGQDKLTPVTRHEKRAMKIFGYNPPDEEHPFLRLACQAKALGNATIVIPPWNGVFGKKVRGNVEDLELTPNTTSAAKLRETIASAASGE